MHRRDFDQHPTLLIEQREQRVLGTVQNSSLCTEALGNPE